MRRSPLPLLLTTLALACATRASALTVTLPNLTGAPGTKVLVPITVSDSPANYGILSIDFQLTLGPAFFAASGCQPDGFLQTWGPPYVNGTASALRAAAAGTTPIATTGMLLNTAALWLYPKVPIGTVIPLAFQHITFNNGTPALSVVPGSITVVAPPAGVDAGGGGLALAVLANPARDRANFAFTVPAGAAPARLEVFDVRGRRVASLAAGAAAGAHEVGWELRSGAGGRVAPGLYLARLTCGAERLVRRVVVAD